MDISSILSNPNFNLYGLGQTSGATSLPGSMEEMVQRLIEDKDKNGNGTLDAAELCISEEAFNQVDADGDGELTSEELVEGAEQIRKAMGPPPGIESPESDDDATAKTLLDYLEEEDDKNAPRTILDLLL
jgi:Ca2+-binding EF-hand superfamily protein